MNNFVADFKTSEPIGNEIFCRHQIGKKQFLNGFAFNRTENRGRDSVDDNRTGTGDRRKNAGHFNFVCGNNRRRDQFSVRIFNQNTFAQFQIAGEFWISFSGCGCGCGQIARRNVDQMEIGQLQFVSGFRDQRKKIHLLIRIGVDPPFNWRKF